jgi:hypothetical protein
MLLWMNYQYSPGWKLSSSLAYYYNRDVPDIGQYKSPEYRLTLQGVYFIHKTGYILTTKMRGELRYMMNAEGVFEDKYRYRQLIKFVKPLNSKVLRKGIVYFLSSEELLFAPNAKTKGINFFDRNRFDIAFGYMITNDLQVELAYLNEYMPRDDGDIINNTVEFTLIFNNLFPRIKKEFFQDQQQMDRQTDYFFFLPFSSPINQANSSLSADLCNFMSIFTSVTSKFRKCSRSFMFMRKSISMTVSYSI